MSDTHRPQHGPDAVPEAPSPVSRRALFGAAAGGAALLAGSALPVEAGRGTLADFLDRLLALLQRRSRPNMDAAILQFALQLEYLEAEFYSYATTGSGIPSSLTTGLGSQGETTGGSQVSFNTLVAANTAVELYQDEVAHVQFLRSTLFSLGATPVAKPAIDLNALGLGFGSEAEFLILGRAFEDTGVSAYGGAAASIVNTNILSAAARILATEAYHAGNLRLQVVQEGLAPVTALDAFDQPPTLDNLFPTDNNGLAVVRTMEQVIAIVAPFFPNGLNGLSSQKLAQIRRSRR